MSAPLYVSGPAFVSGCRHCYGVHGAHPETTRRVFLGRIYAASLEYPKQRDLFRRTDGAVVLDLQPLEAWPYDQPDLAAWAKSVPWYVPGAAQLSDTDLIASAADQLRRLSADLTATYQAALPTYAAGLWVAACNRPLHYSKGPWAAGLLGPDAMQRRTLSAASVRFGSGAMPPRFYLAHASGAVARLSPYWRPNDPTYVYSTQRLAWHVCWLDPDWPDNGAKQAPKPVPKHVLSWLSSRLRIG